MISTRATELRQFIERWHGVRLPINEPPTGQGSIAFGGYVAGDVHSGGTSDDELVMVAKGLDAGAFIRAELSARAPLSPALATLRARLDG